MAFPRFKNNIYYCFKNETSFEEKTVSLIETKIFLLLVALKVMSFNHFSYLEWTDKIFLSTMLYHCNYKHKPKVLTPFGIVVMKKNFSIYRIDLRWGSKRNQQVSYLASLSK